MFCIKCGNDAVAGNFCKDCFLKSNRLFEISDFTVRRCQDCGAFQDGDLDEQIKNAIKTKNRIISFHIKKSESTNRIKVDVACSGYIQSLKHLVKEEKRILVIIKKTKCKKCIQLSGGYYEAVLQIRGDNQERIIKKLKKVLKNEDISKTDRLKEGYDVRLIKKSSAPKIVRFLRDYFDVKESYKLVGEKKGKKLYRNYYAIR